MYHSLCLVAFLQGPPLLSDFRFSPLPEGPASSSDVIVQDAICLLCALCNPKKYQKTFKFYLIFQSMYFMIIAHLLVLDMVMVNIKSYLILSVLDNSMFESFSKLLSK